MTTVTSKDGTTIAYDQVGRGPALILIPGAFEQRAAPFDTSALAAFPQLAQHFTVYHYDRRGRGDSTDTLPFALEREIEDIEAIIDVAGGTAFLSGISSGAALAFEAALALGSKVKKLALYEPPYNDDPEAGAAWKIMRQNLKDTLADGQRGDAVAVFLMGMGMPEEMVAGMREYEMWPMFEAIAPTLAYDAAALGDDQSVPVTKAARITTPTLIMVGGETPYPFMHPTAETLANAIPNAQFRVLEGEVHEVRPEAIAPVLIEFFNN